MTADLIAFLQARLEHDEAVAREATPGPWRNAPTARHHDTVSGRPEEAVFGYDSFRVATTGEPAGRRALVNAEHIARHDPARVLAEVEAKRRIVRAHAKWCEGRCEAKYPEGGFDAAHYWSIKSLAATYADHPDYREEWRP
ncbi:DUF6221 family protein [Streptomyces albidoflavus]